MFSSLIMLSKPSEAGSGLPLWVTCPANSGGLSECILIFQQPAPSLCCLSHPSLPKLLSRRRLLSKSREPRDLSRLPLALTQETQFRLQRIPKKSTLSRPRHSVFSLPGVWRSGCAFGNQCALISNIGANLRKTLGSFRRFLPFPSPPA